MNLLITGAGGFLGRYTVAAAVKRGHKVRALVRPATRRLQSSWRDHPQVEVVRGDLRAREGIDAWLDGVDGVLHLAAVKSGDFYDQFAGTVIATENLLNAMGAADVRRLAVTSSFAVYEYMNRWMWDTLNETSPLAGGQADRDDYCRTKLEQERLVQEFSHEHRGRCVILRPGVVYGRESLWTARLGIQVSKRWWVRMGTFAPLPLTYVENCADAIVQAAEYDGPENPLIVNVVDCDTPSQRTYLKALRKRTTPRPRIFPIPWMIMRLLARTAWLTNRVFFRGTAKMPGLLIPSRLHARAKPLRYSNEKIVSTLGWSPRFTWREGLERACGDQDPSEAPVAPMVADAVTPPATVSAVT